MTREVVEQLKVWIDYKYRKRRICYYEDKEKEEEEGKKTITEYRTPEKKQNELIFSLNHIDNNNPRLELNTTDI